MENENTEKKPSDFIVNPLMSIHTEIDDLGIEMSELKEITKKNSELLSAILSRDTDILKEERDSADEGAVLRKRGTASTTRFFIIDTNEDPGHKVRGYTVKNDGPNTIFVGHNAAFSPQVDADPIDIVSDLSRFEEVLSDENVKFVFNRKKIESIHILSDPSSGLGESQFRAWLVW